MIQYGEQEEVILSLSVYGYIEICLGLWNGHNYLLDCVHKFF